MSIARLTGRWADSRSSRLTGGAQPGDQPLELLTRYIPVESVTLFVATISALGSLHGKPHVPAPWTVYWLFALIVTPAFVLLAALVKAKTSPPFVLPVWPLFSATVAFLAWALAVPGLVQDDSLKILGALAAVFVSTLLSAVGRLF